MESSAKTLLAILRDDCNQEATLVDRINNEDADTNETEKDDSLQSEFAKFENCEHDEVWNQILIITKNNFELATQFLTTSESDLPVEPPEVSKKHAEIIKAVVKLITISLEIENPYVSLSLLQVISCLIRLLQVLSSTTLPFGLKLANLFHDWWMKKLPKSELLGLEAMNYFLNQANFATPTKSNIHKIFQLRSTLSSSKASPELWELVKKFIVSKNFLSFVDGKKFVAFLLTLDETKTKQFHLILKNQLLNSGVKQGENYGSIYYDAWIESEDEIKEVLEKNCIEDLLHITILINSVKQSTVHKTLLRLFGYFHKHQNNHKTATFLLELYRPILWRSLEVTNSFVRHNAAVLLFKFFPLEPPNLVLSDLELEMAKQYDAFKTCLLDNDVSVRIVSIKGVCKILALTWELIPADVIRNILKILIEKLLLDASSPRIRIAVLKGFIAIIGNQLTHITMVVLLPAIKKSFHDVSESVRMTFAELLHKAHKLNVMKYWDVVPMKEIMARLAYETNRNLIVGISSIVHKTYFHSKKETSFQILQTLSLIKKNPEAARKLFTVISTLIPMETTLMFIQQAMQLLNNYSRLKLKELDTSDSTIVSDSLQEAQTGSDAEIIALLDKPLITQGFIEAVSLMYSSIGMELFKDENKALLKSLTNTLTRDMPLIFLYFKKTPAYPTLIFLAGLLPVSVMATLITTCISELGSLPNDSTQETFKPFVLCLLYQKKSGTLLDIISEWLQEGQNKPPGSSRKKKRGKKVQFKEPVAIKPLLAVRIIQDILNNPKCRKFILENEKETILKEVYVPLASFKECVLSSKNATTKQECKIEEIKEGFSLFCQLTILLHPTSDSGDLYAPRIIEDLLAWSEMELFPLFRLKDPDDSACSDKENMPLCSNSNRKRIHSETSKQVVNLEAAKCVVKILLEVVSDMLLTGIVDSDFLVKISTFFEGVMTIELGNEFFQTILKIFYNSVEYVISRDHLEEQENINFLSKMITALLCRLNRNLYEKYKQSSEHIDMSRKVLKTQLIKLSNWVDSESTMLNEVTSVIMAAINAELSYNIQEGEIEPSSKISNLPKLTLMLVGILGLKIELLESFIQEITNCLRDEQTFLSTRICYAFLILIYALWGDREKINLNQNWLKGPVVAAEARIRLLASNFNQGSEDSDSTSITDDAEMFKCGSLIKRLKKEISK